MLETHLIHGLDFIPENVRATNVMMANGQCIGSLVTSDEMATKILIKSEEHEAQHHGWGRTRH